MTRKQHANFRLDEEIMEGFKEAAVKAGRTVSEVLRDSVLPPEWAQALAKFVQYTAPAARDVPTNAAATECMAVALKWVMTANEPRLGARDVEHLTPDETALLFTRWVTCQQIAAREALAKSAGKVLAGELLDYPWVLRRPEGQNMWQVERTEPVPGAFETWAAANEFDVGKMNQLQLAAVKRAYENHRDELGAQYDFGAGD